MENSDYTLNIVSSGIDMAYKNATPNAIQQLQKS